MTVPLRHFVVGLGFLLAGSVLGIGMVGADIPGRGELAHLHLLLVGWICLTIMGAMTQFVPVWSGVDLHSRRLANLQLALVMVGLLGFASAFLVLAVRWLVVFGTLMLAGFWTFVYNIARTLARIEHLDVTERHFAVALVFFVLLTVLGLFLAIDLTVNALPDAGFAHERVLGAHATVAVFGAVLTTIYGALYQLGTMFTQTELHGIDHRLRTLGEVGHPSGVLLLAGGRLLGHVLLAQVGGMLILAAALSFAMVLARKLYEMDVARTPMHRRYMVVVCALGLWALLSLPDWLAAPLDRAHLLGGAGTVHVLVVGVIAFVVLGTLYHIVPFIIWVHRYSDKLGLEAVPMVDELYDDRLARLDGVLFLLGTGLLVAGPQLGAITGLTAVGGGLVTLGVVVFTTNMLLVMRRHGPDPLDRVLLGGYSPRRFVESPDTPTSPERSP